VPSTSEPLRFQGFDIALNHSAVVEIDEFGAVQFFAFTTDKVTIAKDHEQATLYHVTQKRKELKPKRLLTADRLNFFREWISPIVSRKASLAAIESYAYGKKNNAYEIGEFGGCLRSKLQKFSVPYMTVVPLNIKKFAGIDKSEKPIAFCWEEYGEDWEFFNSGLKADTAGDLADAHVLAHMAKKAFGNSRTKLDFGQ